ncbi:CRISPR-associated protein Cas4 [Spiribacter salinus]|uniref:CRISPR-associated protein Cas4 n=1 Tax=Spiribacter salinus TaxID=1335746 RepID=UPI001C973BB1|nr:CRISPR-associated protein Cas4 [Spiribacter salinus]MBY5268289.1 CRISPR-associated protein Cas4 [Spiribacter salinus]
MDDHLPISALQHYAYCPRQFALIHVEQVWAENRSTAEGRVLHERVDSGESETRNGVRYERSVELLSTEHGLAGKMDLLEVEQGPPPVFRPIEYKRGKPKIQDWDRIQLCAQALCIEEMRETRVGEGAIWYWEVRHREVVCIDEALREHTRSCIQGARELLDDGITPAPIDDTKRCRACSLVDICQPQRFRKDASERYVRELLRS